MFNLPCTRSRKEISQYQFTSEISVVFEKVYFLPLIFLPIIQIGLIFIL